jgi:hypothetical protein
MRSTRWTFGRRLPRLLYSTWKVVVGGIANQVLDSQVWNGCLDRTTTGQQKVGSEAGHPPTVAGFQCFHGNRMASGGVKHPCLEAVEPRRRIIGRGSNTIVHQGSAGLKPGRGPR